MQEKKRGRTHSRWLLPAALVLAGAAWFENFTLSTSTVTAACAALPEAFSGLRIVQISDLHGRRQRTVCTPMFAHRSSSSLRCESMRIYASLPRDCRISRTSCAGRFWSYGPFGSSTPARTMEASRKLPLRIGNRPEIVTVILKTDSGEI